MELLLGTFRSDHDNEYDFSKLVCVIRMTALHTIVTKHYNVHSNLGSRVSLFAGKQREGAKLNSCDMTDLKFESRTRTLI